MDTLLPGEFPICLSWGPGDWGACAECGPWCAHQGKQPPDPSTVSPSTRSWMISFSLPLYPNSVWHRSTGYGIKIGVPQKSKVGNCQCRTFHFGGLLKLIDSRPYKCPAKVHPHKSGSNAPPFNDTTRPLSIYVFLWSKLQHGILNECQQDPKTACWENEIILPVLLPCQPFAAGPIMRHRDFVWRGRRCSFGIPRRAKNPFPDELQWGLYSYLQLLIATMFIQTNDMFHLITLVSYSWCFSSNYLWCWSKLEPNYPIMTDQNAENAIIWQDWYRQLGVYPNLRPRAMPT